MTEQIPLLIQGYGGSCAFANGIKNGDVDSFD